MGSRLAKLKAASSSGTSNAIVTHPTLGKGVGSRLKKLQDFAEERGPVPCGEDDAIDEDAERVLTEEDPEYWEPKRVEPVVLEPLNPELPEDALFPQDADARVVVAGGNAGMDVETALIQPGRNVPRLIVVGYQTTNGRQLIVTGDANDPTVHARAFLAFTKPLLPPDDEPLTCACCDSRIVSRQGEWCHVCDPDKTHNIPGGLLVNHNIAFDFCAIAEDAHQADAKLGLVGELESWFEKVMRRIFALLDAGLVEDTQLRERLIDLAEGTLGKDFSSLTVKGNPRRKSYALAPLTRTYLGFEMDKFSYRLGFAKFLNKSISEYPDGAVRYLTLDVEGALHVAARQQQRAEKHGLPRHARIPNSAEQSKARFALNLVSAWGMRTDLRKVQQLDADLDRVSRQTFNVLRETGLIRKDGKDAGKRDMKLVHKYVREAYEKMSLPVPMTESGKNVSTSGGVLEDIAMLTLRGHTRDIVDEKTGQIDETELYQQPLYAYSMYASVQKLINTYLPVLYAGVEYPINTSFECILETGRISSYSPNLNNMPRGGHKTLLARLQARVRQCFVPRQGFLLCSVDYAMLELVTLSQCLLWFFGASKMADAINAGLDLHLLFAAEQLLHTTYDDAKKRKKEKHVADMRQLSKVGNFGFMSNMGAASFVEFSKNSYNLTITEEEARDLKEKWLRQWPEMRAYFRKISSFMRGVDEYGQPIGDIEQFVSGRIRGRARYCATANSFPQALAADASKTALYALQKASYLLGGPLYGSRTVGYFYDEFLMEHPEDTAHERALIQTKIAVDEMQAICTDVKVGAEPALQPYWHKGAECVYSKGGAESGRLIPWVPSEEQTEDYYNAKGELVSLMKRQDG